jgi:hypothetical protein
LALFLFTGANWCQISGVSLFSDPEFKRAIDVGGDTLMAANIKWESDWDMALAMARVQEKHVLLDFSNPG